MVTHSSLTVAETFQNAQADTILLFAAAAVFLAAVLLLLRCFQKIRALSERAGQAEGKGQAQPVLQSQPSPEIPAAPVPARPAAEPAQDLQLIAVITAAIAAAENIPADGIVIRSLRRSPNNHWKRA